MKKEAYIEYADEAVKWVKEIKKRGTFTFSIKMHYMSKLDGVSECAAKDHELEPIDYKRILDKYRDAQDEIWKIKSDHEKEIDI